MKLSEQRTNLLRAHVLIERMEDEIRFLRSMPSWARSQFQFVMRTTTNTTLRGEALTQELAQSREHYRQLTELIDKRIEVLRQRQDRLAARYRTDPDAPWRVLGDWLDTVRAMAANIE